MRTKKTFYNSFAGILYFIITTILTVINRKILISMLGIEYQGIHTLFSDLLNFLSISELGIGAAMVFHLYKPLEQNDTSTITAVLQLYKKLYIVITCTVLTIGCLLIPVLPYIVNMSGIPLSLTIIYLLCLVDFALSYLFTYKRLLLNADQNNYIVLICDILYQLISQILQILLLTYTKNYYIYIACKGLCRFVENLIISKICNDKYPYTTTNIVPKLNPSFYDDLRKKVKGGIFHRIATFIVHGSNGIIISSFLGLTATGIYSNYMLILNALNQVLDYIISAAKASVGQLLATQDTQHKQKIFKQLLCFNAGLTNFTATGFYCIVSILIELIFGSVYLLSEYTIIAMTFYLYFLGIRKVFHIFKEANGIFYEDRFFALSESCINVIACICLVKNFGISGIFWGAVIGYSILYFYTYPVLVCKRTLCINYLEYYKYIISYFLVFLTSIVSTKALLHLIAHQSLYIQLLQGFLGSLIIPNIIFIFFVHRKTEFRFLLERLKILLLKVR